MNLMYDSDLHRSFNSKKVRRGLNDPHSDILGVQRTPCPVARPPVTGGIE